MMKHAKNVNLLYIFHKDSILMRTFIHQNYEVIDVFSFKDSAENKLISLFGRTFEHHCQGNIKSVINKKDSTVSIDIKAYKVVLDRNYKVLDTYADDVIKSGSETFWLHKNQIKDEKRMREGDKKVIEEVFCDKHIDIMMVENQGDRWIDAETIVFETR